MSRKRRTFSAEFKVKLAGEHHVHPNQITLWKKQLIETLPEVFGRRREQSDEQQQELIDRLYEQIGRLKVELDFDCQ